MLLTTLLILVLSIPTAFALWDDRKGDKHPNNDLLMIGLLMFVTSSICVIADPLTGVRWVDFLRCIVLSGAIYVSVFPYAANYMFIKRGIISKRAKWYDHLSKTAWPDRLEFWQATPWYGRMFFALVILLAALQCYFCPGKIVDYFNACNCVSKY